MTYDPNDPDRPLDPRNTRFTPAEERSSGMVWGTLAVLAILIIGGVLLYSGGDRTRTASNQPTTTQSTTTQSTPAPSPGPAPTPKQ